MPKPEGLLRQRSAPIEGWGGALAPLELTEYLRAMAGLHASVAVEAVEKGELWEAVCRWGTAGEILTRLTLFDPTREVLAGALLARAGCCSLWAAHDARMGGAAGLFAKAAGRVFFGEAPPDALLEVLLEAPYPTEYDPGMAPHYREAAGCLVAAHWVLTGEDPKRLTEWFWPGRWNRDDAEAMLLFSLGSEKKRRACAHLYLGDLPF